MYMAKSAWRSSSAAFAVSWRFLGDADAHRDAQADPADAERRGHGDQDPLGDLDGGAGAVVFDDHDGELVAAEPGDKVVGADAVGEPGGQLDQKGVAAFVTERVVDFFEVVDVDEKHAVLAGLGGRRRGGTMPSAVRSTKPGSAGR